MLKKINLLEITSETIQPDLELVRLGSNETAIFPFTDESEEVKLHFCNSPDINTYILCNGDDCVCCRAGMNPDLRLLLPVYLPASDTVEVLQISTSLRPHALLPQILNILKAEVAMVMFIIRENKTKYLVDHKELKEDMAGGEVVIKKFLEEYNNGSYNLSSLYKRMDNEELKNLPEIARMLRLKGIE